MKRAKSAFVVPLLLLLATVCVDLAKAAGEADPAFNASAYGELSNQGIVNVVRLQADGKILVGGLFTEVQGFGASGLARLNADGTVDSSFNPPDFYGYNPISGSALIGGEIFAIVVQADGKIIVGGNIRGANGDGKAGIRRLNPDGSVDTSFTILQLSIGSVVYDMDLQADGKIVIGGLLSVGGTNHLARLNADGTQDTTFLFPASVGIVKDLDIQPNGMIVTGGYNSAGTVTYVRRFTVSGTADPAFTPIESGGDKVEAVKLQSDGKIVVAGSFTTLGFATLGRIARLNTDGSADLSFNSGNAGANGVINDISIRTDGKIVIAGGFSTINGTIMQRVARLNADGTLDAGFTISGTINDPTINDIELLADNRTIGGRPTTALVDPMVRFGPDGVVDPSFVVKASKGGFVRKVLRQPDGKILIGGNFLYADGVQRRSMARLNEDGTLDPSFVPYFNTGSPLQTINAIALQPDGKILVGATNGIVLRRLNSDGSLDTTFNASLPSSGTVYDIVVQADGKIFIGGILNIALPTFARLNADGTRDLTFNPAQPVGTVRRVIVQPDGKLLVGGAFSTISDIGTRHSLTRYNADGVLDNSFVPPVGNPFVVDMALQADGKVVQCGHEVRRLNTNGTLDATINYFANAEVDAVDIQPDGKIIVGGGFSVIGEFHKNGIARLNPNGTLDNGFTTFANRDVFDIQVQPDSKILIGGAFTKLTGVPRVRVARLLNTSVSASKPFDFDGDGKADISVFRPSENRWYVFRSSDSLVAQQVFAIPGDVPAPADYDGDSKTDYAIYRPASGAWWYLSSFNGAQITAQWGGQAGDVPKPSDWDGDGRADFIVFRPSDNFWYRISSVSGAVSNINFGLAGDKPVIGDFDGDGKSDVANYRPSDGNWWWQSSVDNVQRATRWGIASDLPVPADFDGDGKTDFAVFRPSTGVWYIYNSATNTSTIGPFGLSEDKPVAADYDGDGKADIAVFRPSTSVWYQLRSTSGFSAMQFGVATDIPMPNTFVP